MSSLKMLVHGSILLHRFPRDNYFYINREAFDMVNSTFQNLLPITGYMSFAYSINFCENSGESMEMSSN